MSILNSSFLLPPPPLLPPLTHPPRRTSHFPRLAPGKRHAREALGARSRIHSHLLLGEVGGWVDGRDRDVFR